MPGRGTPLFGTRPHISTAPAIAERIADQRDLIDTTKQKRNAYLITFGGCAAL